MDSRAVGVFDSGLGGLTSVRELRKILPNEKIVFLGDTLRVPYGTRDRDTLLRFARDDFRFLLSKNVKHIVIACGTISSNIDSELLESVPVPVTGVIGPTVAAAAKATRNGAVGVIATTACIRSGAYQSSLEKADPSMRIAAVDCPRLVPLIESGCVSDKVPELTEALEEYLAPVKEIGADTLILGCTHYPLVSDIISSILGTGVTLIDSGAEAARAARDSMAASDSLSPSAVAAASEFYVTSDPLRFTSSSGFFLGESIPEAELVSLDNGPKAKGNE